MSAEKEYLRDRLRMFIEKKRESVVNVRKEQPSKSKADTLLYLLGQIDAISILSGSTVGLEGISADIEVIREEVRALRMENFEAIHEKSRTNV